MKLTEGKSRTSWERKWLIWAFILISAGVANTQNMQNERGTFLKTRRIRHVLVSIADRRLAVLEDGRIIRSFPVSVGAEGSPSPTGRFQIVSRVANPAYYHSGVVIPPGKDNPVGPAWLGLNQKGYGIHGTNEPKSIGKAASHGCIRLRNRDIEQLLALVSVGDIVEIRGARDEEMAEIFADTEAAPVEPATPTGAGQ
jgi:lipoprotein-anchoring transpeptidase ErfK/SrfK